MTMNWSKMPNCGENHLQSLVHLVTEMLQPWIKKKDLLCVRYCVFMLVCSNTWWVRECWNVQSACLSLSRAVLRMYSTRAQHMLIMECTVNMYQYMKLFFCMLLYTRHNKTIEGKIWHLCPLFTPTKSHLNHYTTFFFFLLMHFVDSKVWNGSHAEEAIKVIWSWVLRVHFNCSFSHFTVNMLHPKKEQQRWTGYTQIIHSTSSNWQLWTNKTEKCLRWSPWGQLFSSS